MDWSERIISKIVSTKSAHHHDYEALLKDIIENWKGITNEEKFFPSYAKDFILTRFDINKIADEVLEIYKSEIMRKAFQGTIPILMYHKIPDNPIESPNKIFVTKRNFEKHLRFFKLRGLTPITFKDYIDFREGVVSTSNFPKRPIVLTFDDGYVDNLTNLLPLMSKFGYKGVIFLLGDPSITYNYWDADKGDHRDELMCTEQKKKFVEAGWEIGSHTLTHPHLTTLSSELVAKEIIESKKSLEVDLKTQVISFAFPYGDLDEAVKEISKKSGHIFSIATDSGGMNIEDDFHQVFRVNMFPDESFLQLYKKTSHWYRAYYAKKRAH
jgi:peptidoglycan/xylan/chitin deacetylase (PgdA/CDA1 family)